MKEAQFPSLVHIFKDPSRGKVDQCQSMKLVISDKQVLGLQLFLYPRLDPELQVEVESILGDHEKVLENAERRLAIFICMKISLYPSLYYPELINLRSIRSYPWDTIWIEKYGTDSLDIPVIFTDNWQNASQNDVESTWWHHLRIIGEV